MNVAVTGGTTIVDADVFESVRTIYFRDGDCWELRPSQINWYLANTRKETGRRYCMSHVQRSKRRRPVFLHRLLTECPADLMVDHINGDGLDNRMTNLRCVDYRTNNWNGTLSPRFIKTTAAEARIHELKRIIESAEREIESLEANGV